jgi:CheY-like chemotaxis protein
VAKKVLTIDDSKALRSIIGRALKPLGIDVLEAENGAVGLDVAKAQNPDVILLDFHMPVMDGFETLHVIKGDPQLSKIPIVMLTTEAGEQTVLRLLKLGVKDYILKPFDRSDVLKAINKFLNLFEAGVVPSDDELDELASKARLPSILVVDDKENILRLFETHIDASAYQLQTASGGFAALAAIKQKPPSILFVDIDMPGMSGIELYEKIRPIVREHQMAVVALALRTAEDQTAQASKAGITEFLLKPFFKEDLTRILGRLSGSKRYLTESNGVKLLAFPDRGDVKLSRFKSALTTDILREVNEMADEGENKLVVKLTGALHSDLALAQNFASLLEYLEKLMFEVRLVADTEEAREGLKQYLETTRMTAYASVDDAIGALG